MKLKVKEKEGKKKPILPFSTGASDSCCLLSLCLLLKGRKDLCTLHIHTPVLRAVGGQANSSERVTSSIASHFAAAGDGGKDNVHKKSGGRRQRSRVVVVVAMALCKTNMVGTAMLVVVVLLAHQSATVEALRVRGRVKDGSSWVYLERFCFAPHDGSPEASAGSFEYNITFPKNSSLGLAVYWYDKNQWNDAYLDHSLTCQQRLQQPIESGNLFPIDSWATPYKGEGGNRPFLELKRDYEKGHLVHRPNLFSRARVRVFTLFSSIAREHVIECPIIATALWTLLSI